MPGKPIYVGSLVRATCEGVVRSNCASACFTHLFRPRRPARFLKERDVSVWARPESLLTRWPCRQGPATLHRLLEKDSTASDLAPGLQETLGSVGLGTTGIWGWRSLCGGRPGHWMLSGIPGLCPLDASSCPPIVTTKDVFRHCQTSLGASRALLSRSVSIICCRTET